VQVGFIFEKDHPPLRSSGGCRIISLGKRTEEEQKSMNVEVLGTVKKGSQPGFFFR